MPGRRIEAASGSAAQPPLTGSAAGTGSWPALTDDLIAAFAATEIEIDHPCGRLLVRPAPRTGATAAGPRLVWPIPDPPALWVITAWNPGSVPCADDRNRRRQALLERELAGMSPQRWHAVGRAPDGSWEEESVAVGGLDRAAATAIGREFGQLAVFEVADLIRVVRCVDLRVVSRRGGTVERRA